jgi:eukaryotic-like serine/threonine-protein kinase
MRYRRAVVAAVVAERYELEQRIGRGGMGEVWSARDRLTGAEVAVKLARGWAFSDPEMRQRFEREGTLLRRLKTPFVCALLDAGHTEEGAPYLVLERLNGETLEAVLARETYLALDEIGPLADEVLQALVVAHAAGIVHRDLSPANVFLHRMPDGPVRTKILDFGIAKASDPNDPGVRTAKGATMGSLPYIAPEQLGDSARAGPRADLYALGTIVFRALTGCLPYGDAKGTALVILKREHDPPSIDEATGEKWPAALRTFLGKTMARAPSKRYPSAEVAIAALREAVRGRGPKLAPPAKIEGVTTTATLGDPPARRSK